MLNYMKSEFFRITGSKDIYLFTFGIAAFALAVNLLLFAMNHIEPGFPYGTIRFSLSTFIGFIYFIMLGAGLIRVLLYGDENRNGTMKNAIISGLSRTQIFIVKCLIGIFVGFISMIVILAIYLGSAFLLLDGPGDEALYVLMQGLVAILPTAIAALVFGVAAFHFIKNTNWAQIFWIVVLFAVPILLYMLGTYFEPLSLAASWLPTNIFLYEVGMTASSFDCVWQTSFGMMKCLVSGFVALIVFTGFGLWVTRKMEF